MRFLIRVLLALIMIPLLIPVTIYARYKNLDRLPFGFEKISGNKEDNWDGNGGALVGRKHWNLNGTVSLNNGVNGWYQDYLRQRGIIWQQLGFWGQWWHSYKWCALRNPVWNVRYLPYLSASCNKADVLEFQNSGNCEEVIKNSNINLSYSFWWKNKNGKKYKSNYRHIKIKGKYFLHLRWGWKAYPKLFKINKTPLFKQRTVPIFNFEIVNIKKQ